MARRGIVNQAEFEARLRAIPQAVRDAAKAANEKAAAETVARLKLTVPHGPDKRGHIVDSIRMEPGRHDLEVVIKVGSEAVPYAAPLEFGHKNKDGSRTRPTKFFFPTIKVMRKKWRARMQRAIRAALKKLSK
jgi:HK97 gp10 family phage protein